MSRPISGWQRAEWAERIALLCFVSLLVLAAVAPAVAPHSAVQSAGTPLSPPSAHAFFGTDDAGRDIFSRVILGLRSSVAAAAAVIASGIVIGAAVGVTAGLARRWPDVVLMRATDLFLALPGPLLAIVIVAAMGPSFLHTLVAVAIVWWPLYARVFRGETVSLAARPYVEAARLGRLPRGRLTRRHVLPGLLPSLLVLASLDVGNLVLTLAALSFLGLGAPAPTPELGAMAAQGLSYLTSAWWVPVVPSLAVMLLAWIANLAGDAIRNMARTESR